MQKLKGIVLVLALVQGSWLTFDGIRALLVGDYVTPTSGSRAGQLGPWSLIVTAIGFEPRSKFVKFVHVFLGIAWIIASVVFLSRPGAGWWAVLFCSLASLWYLPIGTFVSIIVIGLLSSPQLRSLM